MSSEAIQQVQQKSNSDFNISFDRGRKGARDLAIIDSKVDGLEDVIAGIRSGTECLVLHPNLDGMTQITAALESRDNFSSLHLIAHGSPGCMYLGSTQLSLDTLWKYGSDLKLWSELLAGKDVLIYGCEVAQGQSGNLFLQHLHQLTNANLAASTTKVGRTEMGHNWELDTKVGAVTSDIILSASLQNSYRGHFAEVSFSIEQDVAIETEGTRVTFNFTLDEPPPPEGTVVVLTSSEPSSVNRFALGAFGEALELNGVDNPLFYDVSANLDFTSLAVNIKQQNASFSANVINTPNDGSLDNPATNPDIEDAADVAEEITWTISTIAQADVPDGLGTPGTVAAGASSDTIIYADNAGQLNASVPEISITSDIDTLVEDEGTEVTLIIELSEAPPSGGLAIPIETGKPFALGDFDIFPPPPFARATGGNLIGGFDDNSGFNFLVTAQTATVTLPVFDDQDRTANGAVTDPTGPLRNDDIGEEQTTFSIGTGDGYTVSASAGSVTLTIIDTNIPPNTPPVADDDAYTTAFETALTVDAATGVLDGDVDADGDALTVAIATDPSSGSVTLSGDGSFTYTPNAGFSGDDTFTYTVDDGNSGTDTGTVTVSVAGPVNSDPVADDDAYTTAFETALTVDAATGVLNGDVDADGDTLTVAIASAPSNGNVTLNGDGSFTYTPNAGFSGEDSFTYTVDDGNGGTDTGIVTISVAGPVNSDPVADDDIYITAFETALVVDAAMGVLEGDLDADGDALTVAIATAPSNGSVTLNSDGSFTYTPNAGFSGDDTFTYTVVDGNGGTDTGTVTVSVAEQINTPPVADDDVYTTAFDTVLTVDAVAGVLDGDVDADGDALTVAIASDPTSGSVALSNDGSFTYTPDAGFSGEDSFTYTVDDSNGGTDTGTVTVSVAGPVNSDPVADDDTYTTAFDTTLIVDAANGVLDGDVDADGDALTASIASAPSNGTVNISADGALTYTPAAGFSGDDTFTYTVSDGNGGTDTGTVTISVAGPVNSAPVADDDVYTTAFDTALTVDAATGVLDGDIDADGDALTATIASAPGNGNVTLDNSGSFTYTPNAGFSGEDSFTYTVSDSNGGTDTGTVTISVAGQVNSAPVADDDAYTTASGTPLTVDAATGVLDGDVDADGDTLTVAIADTPSNGSVALNGDGSFTYTPDADFSGEDSFTYTVDDGNGGTDTGTVTVSVAGPVNSAPVADDDAYTTAFETVLTVDAANGVLDGDVDVDGDALTASIASAPSNGTVNISANGALTYTPATGFSGDDTFTYTVSDGNGGTDTGTVTVSVAGLVNSAPVADNDVYTAAFETALTVDAATGVLDGDIDADGDILTATIADLPGNGNVTLGSDGAFTYTPNAGFSGDDSFTYTVSDGNGGTNTGTVTISVAAPSQPTFIDFDSSDLAVGDVVNNQIDNLTVSTDSDLVPMIFDSANPTGGDTDLASPELGHILIISEDGDSADPDDNAKGGTLMLDWDGVVNVDSLGLLDIEEMGSMVTLYGADDMTVLATIDIPSLANNSYQSLDINVSDVGKMDVLLTGSGAITDIALNNAGDGVV
ncbi:MAG: Ig-like domain-containing protein [Cyanobacteria bacterium P01_F01_bin.150]